MGYRKQKKTERINLFLLRYIIAVICYSFREITPNLKALSAALPTSRSLTKFSEGKPRFHSGGHAIKIGGPHTKSSGVDGLFADHELMPVVPVRSTFNTLL